MHRPRSAICFYSKKCGCTWCNKELCWATTRFTIGGRGAMINSMHRTGSCSCLRKGCASIWAVCAFPQRGTAWNKRQQPRTRDDAPGSERSFPRGRLVFDLAVAALLADEMVALSDSRAHPVLRRRRTQCQRSAPAGAAVQPEAARRKRQLPAGELGLERLTEWLATRVGMRYLRIDLDLGGRRLADRSGLLRALGGGAAINLPLAVNTERARWWPPA